MKEASVLLILFVFILCYSSVYGKEKSSEDNNGSYEKSKDARNSSIISIIDPSVCENNAEGYIYFQIGDEVFRYTKKSPIQISRINSRSELRKSKSTHPENVPEGCNGNPYSDVVIYYSYDQMDESYKKIKTIKFMLLPTKDEVNISNGQIFYQHSYQDYLDAASKCFSLSMDIDKCIWPDRSATRLQIYKSKFYKIMEIPYILECINFVGDIECSTFYRIYKTLNFSYSFYLSENKYWEEKEILKFDQYLIGVLEGMRVTDKSNSIL